MPESIIAGIREYIDAVPLMREFDKKNRHINWTDADNDNYGIFPDTDSLLEEYVDGTEIRKYVCQINIRRFAALDADRLKNTEFLERLQRWFAKQTDEENLPEMPEGCTPEEITADNAMLLDMDAAGKKGTYTIQIILKYTREPTIKKSTGERKDSQRINKFKKEYSKADRREAANKKIRKTRVIENGSRSSYRTS